MKNLLISSKLFVYLVSTINFSSLRLDIFIQLLNTSSVIVGLEFVFFESLLGSQRESAPFVDSEESWFAHFLSCDADFLWRLSSLHQTDQQQVALFYDRQTSTVWTTFLRPESVSLVCGSRCIFSLLGEHWWRERCADGVGRWLKVMRVQGPVLAGGQVPFLAWPGGRWALNLWDGRTRQGCQGPH